MSGWSSGEKLAVVGAGTVVVLSITVLAYVVSRCRRAHWRCSRALARGDQAGAEAIRQEAIKLGCDWPSKVA